MEADWDVEIGADLPGIVVPWEGFIDLRREASQAYELSETDSSPVLAQFLIKLNQDGSPVFTSKCDLWRLAAEEIDPLEFDAPGESAQQGLACYIDIIAHDLSLFSSFPAHEKWVRLATSEMHRTKLSCCRVDLVVRSSVVDERDGYALTLYAASCGPTEDVARSIFPAVLEITVAIAINTAATAGK